MKNRSNSKFALVFWVFTSATIFGSSFLHAQSFRLDPNLDYCEDDWYPGSCSQQRAQGGFKNVTGKSAKTANEISPEMVVECLGGVADKCQNIIDSGFIPPANQCAKFNVCALGATAYISMDNDDVASKYWEEIIKLSPSQLPQDFALQIMNRITQGQIDFIPFQESLYEDLHMYYTNKADEINRIRIAKLGCDTVTHKEYLPRLCSTLIVVAHTAEEYHLAYKYAKKVCDLNATTAIAKGYVGDACGLLGLFHSEGIGTRQDYTKARTYAQRGCDLDSANSCELLGRLYYRSRSQGGVKSLQSAKRYYGKGCDLGQQTSCDKYKALNQQGVQ